MEFKSQGINVLPATEKLASTDGNAFFTSENVRIILNSLIAGGLVFFGALISGQINLNIFIAASAAAGIAALTQLRKDINKGGAFVWI